MRRGRKSISQTPAPQKDRVKGSKVNPKGSAASQSSASSIKLSESIISTLEKKAKEYNKKHPNKKVRVSTLKAVFRRGAGAYSSSHRPTITGGVPNSRSAWAFARVNKFLLKKGGTKVKAAYVQDDDLMKDGGLLKSLSMGMDNLKKNGIVLKDENTIVIAYNTGNQEIQPSLYNKALIYKSIKLIKSASNIIEKLDLEQYERFEEDKINDYKKGHLIILNQNEVIYDSENEEITCHNCGWEWNTDDSKKFDKYVCHKCGFDNKIYYKMGGSLKKPHNIIQIAKKHKVSATSLMSQLKKGIATEMEHTKDKTTARTIALHHLWESPKYYEKLQVMEKSFKDGGEVAAYASGKAGGVLVGRRHSQGGIKAINKSNNQPLEMEGGEVVITRNAVSDNQKREFEGEMLTNKEILSRINQSGGGVAFANGGKVKDCGCSGKKYKYGGKMMTDFDIVESIRSASELPMNLNKKAIDMSGVQYANLKPSEAVDKLYSAVKFEDGGILDKAGDSIRMINKRIPSLKGFLKLSRWVESPYDNDLSRYVPIKQFKSIVYAKGGNIDLGTITNAQAYKTYLFDNFGIKFRDLPSKIQNALLMGEQKLIDNYINE